MDLFALQHQLDAVQALTRLTLLNPPYLRVQAQMLGDPVLDVLTKLSKNPKLRITLTLGPPRHYELNDQGFPIGRSAYAPDIKKALDKVADIGDAVITPKFTEFEGDKPNLGVQSHAFFVTATNTAMLCTSSPVMVSSAQAPVCADGLSPELSAGLATLHDADFDLSAKPEKTQARLTAAAKAGVVFSPENISPLMQLLHQDNLTISTATITDNRVLQALKPHATTLTLVMPTRALADEGVKQLVQAGAKFLPQKNAHGGLIVVGAEYSFIGSLRLEKIHLQSSRDAGIIFFTKKVATIKRFVV